MKVLGARFVILSFIFRSDIVWNVNHFGIRTKMNHLSLPFSFWKKQWWGSHDISCFNKFSLFYPHRFGFKIEDLDSMSREKENLMSPYNRKKTKSRISETMEFKVISLLFPIWLKAEPPECPILHMVELTPASSWRRNIPTQVPYQGPWNPGMGHSLLRLFQIWVLPKTYIAHFFSCSQKPH